MTRAIPTTFITGAATGIGRALVEKLDAEGWRCFVGYNRQPPDAVMTACGPRAVAVRCNLTDDASVKAAISEIEAALAGAPLDLLVNNGATTGGAGGGIENVDIDRFKFPGDAIEAAFRTWTPAQFADRVYRDVLGAKAFKPNYLLGPGVAALPVMKRTLPDRVQERIFERMFRR